VQINKKKERETPWESSGPSKGDDTMAYTSSALAPRDIALSKLNLRAQRGLFARLLDAMMASRQRQTDRDIARYLMATGFHGRLTDSIEREIERRFLSNPSSW
jgi:hypothetical protein